MALIRDYDLPGGITVRDAYFVITNLVATKKLLDITPAVPAIPGMPAVTDPETGEITTPEIPAVPEVPEVRTLSQKWLCQILVSIFKDKSTREAGGAAVAVLPDASGAPFNTSFEYDPAGSLPIVQGYAHLVSQPYFSGATIDTDS